MLLESLNDRLRGWPRGRMREVTAHIRSQKDVWLAEWHPHLTSEAKPLSPYRIIHELLQVADVPNTIITTTRAARATSCRRSGTPSHR